MSNEPQRRPKTTIELINAILDAEADAGEEWDDSRKVGLLSEAVHLFEEEASAAAACRVRKALKERAHRV